MTEETNLKARLRVSYNGPNSREVQACRDIVETFSGSHVCKRIHVSPYVIVEKNAVNFFYMCKIKNKYFCAKNGCQNMN